MLDDQGIDQVNAVFMDLGLSSLQIDETERGFSYSHDAPLDMRMDVTQPLTAEQVLAEYSFADLARISVRMVRNASPSRSPVRSCVGVRSSR